MAQPNFEIAIDTRLLYQRLKEVAVGSDVTYPDLSKVVSRAVRGADSHLQAAIRMCQTNDRIVFDNIRGVGYRRLNDEQIIDSATRDTDALRRRSRRAAKKLTMVNDFAALPSEKRIEHNARLSLFSAIAAMTKSGGVEAIRNEVKSAGGELPFAKTLAAFRQQR